VVKEVRMTPKIEAHDYETKKNAIEKFLKGGDKVKITMKFRGREQTRPEMGFKLLQRLAEDVAELGFVEFAPKQEGRNMTMVLGPTKKKTEAVAEQKAARAAAEKAKQEAEK
jgi:translation initiation factor IF-3